VEQNIHQNDLEAVCYDKSAEGIDTVITYI